MAGVISVDDRIRNEYATLIDNFTNLIKAAKLQDPARDQAAAPGEMMEVFAEKMLASCRALLTITSELKKNALLNEVEARNAEVRSLIENDGTTSAKIEDGQAPEPMV